MLQVLKTVSTSFIVTTNLIKTTKTTSKAAADHNCSSSDSSKMEQGVTVAEIRPIAVTIRKAFGLELFGFDILVARTEGNRKEMLVVDVNYFSSYKEVTNFSKMLAQYLAQCGIEGRLRSFEAER